MKNLQLPSGKKIQFNIKIISLIDSAVFTARKLSSFGKVMFLHLSVILFTGGVSVQGGHCHGYSGRVGGMHSCCNALLGRGIWFT